MLNNIPSNLVDHRIIIYDNDFKGSINSLIEEIKPLIKLNWLFINTSSSVNISDKIKEGNSVSNIGFENAIVIIDTSKMP